MPETEGVNHVALTVTDIDASVAWYQALFEGQILWEERTDAHDMIVVFAPPLAIGIHRHSATAPGDIWMDIRAVEARRTPARAEP